jgi:hypothetical protein
MDRDFTPFSMTFIRARFWRDGRKSVENGEPEPGMPTGAIIAGIPTFKCRFKPRRPRHFELTSSPHPQHTTGQRSRRDF